MTVGDLEAPSALPVERPVLFSAPMVRAILEGRKTQTRRLVRPMVTAPLPTSSGVWTYECDANGFGGLVQRFAGGTSCSPLPRCPYGVPGDHLWVRETHLRGDEPGGTVWYRATEPERVHGSVRWRPGIHMPRWASRITLEVTDVRVQRLQDIGEDDARAEGVDVRHDVFHPAIQSSIDNPARRSYAVLWDQISGKRAPWASNPWVWAISFHRHAQPKA